ncbi:MAG: sensor histidine kinase [Bacteriovoracia bacterium]
MKSESLEQNVKRQALAWTSAGIVFTLCLTGSLSLFLMFKDTERQVETLSTSAITSERTDILSGDIRSIELRLRKNFGIAPDERLLFLDSKRAPWVGDLKQEKLSPCASQIPCRQWFNQRIVLEKPIYFDDEGKHLWGYLHIEKEAKANWSLILGVAISIVLGMLFQGIGAYYKTLKSIRAVSAVLAAWAKKISENPKDQSAYTQVPFTEIAPVGNALHGMKDYIDALESNAREQGALVTLRGIGHDILNPVARMKRILGLIEIEKQSNPENIASLRANLKRLSSYAEQLKLIYKRQIGEADDTAPTVDVAKEVRELASELLTDPEAIEKGLKLQVDAQTPCVSRIPAPALNRIVENLCSNGIYASPEGATLSLKVESNGDRVSILVRDEGSGIPDVLQAKIFEPDFTTKGNKGTGLGLFVVKQICEQYGGRIAFSSSKSGTAFTLDFPRVEVSL